MGAFMLLLADVSMEVDKYTQSSGIEASVSTADTIIDNLDSRESDPQ